MFDRERVFLTLVQSEEGLLSVWRWRKRKKRQEVQVEVGKCPLVVLKKKRNLQVSAGWSLHSLDSKT